MSITSPYLFPLIVCAAALVAGLIVFLWTRSKGARARGTRSPGVLGRAMAVLGRVGLLGLLLGLAGSALFFKVNDTFGFYANWSDLAGIQRNQPDAVSAAGLVTGKGKLEKLTVDKGVAGVKGQALVWLPPQYNDPAWANKRFPVVMMLPGQTGPAPLIRHFDFGQQATKAVTRGRIPPFVAVFPPIVIAPPRDTQCINVPNGPKAESWLTKDVPAALQRHFRVDKPGRKWSIVGFSTGGFCAANLSLRNPQTFGAAVALGANYVPYADHTTGDLFNANPTRRDGNTPEWLYRHNGGTRGVKLLMVSGRQDRETWNQTHAMLALSKGDPHVSLRSFPQGGHNYRNYRKQLPYSFTYLNKVGAL